MGTFGMWLEARKNGLNETQIDDHKLVAMLNETYRQNRKLINRLAESEDLLEIKEKLRQLSPKVLLKVEGLGKQAMLAALMGLGGVGAQVGSNYLDAVSKSKNAAPVQGLLDMERRGNKEDRAALRDMDQLGREEEKRMKLAADLESYEDDKMDTIAKYGKHGLGFGYTDSGSNEPATPAEQWEIMKRYAKEAREAEAKQRRDRAARDDEYKKYQDDLRRRQEELKRARDTRVRGGPGEFTVTNPPPSR